MTELNELLKRTWVEVDLDAIEANYRAIRATLPQGCRFLGVVKANAYGHGAIPVARRLEKLGCDYLAVACFDEAAQLRQAGITLPILILGPSPAELAPELARLHLTQAVGDWGMAQALSRTLHGETLTIHMKVETGMGRTGFTAGDAGSLVEMQQTLSLPGLAVEGIFTHFAVSDEFGDDFTVTQFNRFMSTIGALETATGHKFAIRHCANSGAVINYPWACLDMVRPGLALYGMYPAAERGQLTLRPAMALKSRVGIITTHQPGDTVSYGRTFTVERPSRFAVVLIGYADGLHRVLSGKMEVLIRGQRAPQRGRICMDMCMVDVTDLPEVRPGDEVTIFGEDMPIETLAEQAGTISYELCCAPAPRIPRVYLNE